MTEEALLVFVGLTLFVGGWFVVYLLVRHWEIIRNPGSFAAGTEAVYADDRLEKSLRSAKLQLIVAAGPEAHINVRPRSESRP